MLLHLECRVVFFFHVVLYKGAKAKTKAVRID